MTKFPIKYNAKLLQIILGSILSILVPFPHELLHAICFKETVYLYTTPKQSICRVFLTGSEDMSKARFIFMCLLPSIVFGFIPFTVFLIFPDIVFLGTLGAFAIGQGAGDYINAINALIQMPKGARTYLYGIHSYWFMPEKKN